MTEDYFNQMLELATGIVALADVESKIDKRQWKAAKEHHDSLEANFRVARNKYVDQMLGIPEGHEQACEYVKQDIAEVRARCDPAALPAVDYVSDNLLPFLQKEANRDPRIRKAIKATPWALGGIAIIAYFVVRFASATPINHALETKSGIQERAAAVVKLLRYDELMDTHVRRGGWAKGLLFWPVEPTDAEIKGASEFAALAFQSHEVSVQQFGCLEIPRGSESVPSKEELDFLAETSAYIQNSEIQWKNPPVDTVIDASKAFGKC